MRNIVQMCGIVAYTGPSPCASLLLEGLKRLEYRGYDSAGLALLTPEGNFAIYKQSGKVSALITSIPNQAPKAYTGIAHTRWATHGAPTDINAHPHLSYDGQIVLVHNGIIENYQQLRQNLEREGIRFESETDSEVLCHWIAYTWQQHPNWSWPDILKEAFRRVEGTFGVAFLRRTHPSELTVVRRFSPIVIGLLPQGYLVASDATPIVPHTRQVLHLEDDELAILSPDRPEPEIHAFTTTRRQPQIEYIDWTVSEIEKDGFPHYMLKEIFEQPRGIQDCMRGRIRKEPAEVRLGGIANVMEHLVAAPRLIITACGTSYHAGLVGKYLIEQLAQLPVDVEYASEFRYREPVLSTQDVVLGISQSGETADTLAALRLARERGLLVLGITNVVGSSIPRITHAGVYIHVGPEIGVASTKAFTGQLTALTLFALHLGAARYKVDRNLHDTLIENLIQLPTLMEGVLQRLNLQTKAIAEKLSDKAHCLFLGRGYHYPVALEGALKLKEISYIHAEAYPAGEMKHGPIALIDADMPIVFIAVQDRLYEKSLSNLQEVRARGGYLIAIATEGDEQIAKYADEVLYVPPLAEQLYPILTVLPLQLLAYHTAVLRGCDVDQPRNLAKSVTVE